MSRVLILTAGYGEGHNAAARNLETAFNESCGANTASSVDLLLQASPRLSRITRWGYLTAINRFPKGWSALYRWLDQSHPFPRALWVLRRELRLLDELIRRENPTVICSTFPIYGFLIEKLRHEHGLSIPFYNIVTDSISINSLWWLPQCDGWFLPNEESAQIIRDAGRPANRVHVSGFPVQPDFARESKTLAPPNLAAGHAPRVLFIINSGSARAEETARLLLAETGWEITCAVGRHDALRHRLEKLATRRGNRATVLGWTDQVPQLLMTHHVVVSKAGGATTQEAIAAYCPMIVNQIIPGQEEGNYELLRRHGIGAHAASPAEVISALRNAFAQNGNIWRQWRRSLDSLSRPSAATDIVDRLAREHGIETNPILREPTPSALTRHG
ncbi:MAG: galactosyldiacylglycerol synthase [Opitutaceae bacterium]|nr:galactosyldiacylglycerol synthase [Opitutaceae bacterium]